MAWLYLAIASVFEIGWAVGLKYTDGLTRPGPTVATVAAMLASFYFLAMAVKSIPIGTGYAIWTGVGAAGTAMLGMLLFAEPATPARWGCIALIVAGVAGLKVTSGT